MIEQLLAAIDSVLPEPLTQTQGQQLEKLFARILDVKPVVQVCEAIDQLKQRGLGVSIVKCGGLELQLYQVHKPLSPMGDTPAEDDPLLDGTRGLEYRSQ